IHQLMVGDQLATRSKSCVGKLAQLAFARLRDALGARRRGQIEILDRSVLDGKADRNKLLRSATEHHGGRIEGWKDLLRLLVLARKGVGHVEDVLGLLVDDEIHGGLRSEL